MKVGVDSVVLEVKGLPVEIDVYSLRCTLHMPTNGSRSDDLTKSKIGLKVIIEHEDVEGIKKVSAK